MALSEALARIWAEALKLARVGRHDNFFALGGHSLLALSIIERMRHEGLHTDVRTLFATPTMAALASAVSGKSDLIDVPPNRIPPGCDAITPEMLPLAQLSEVEIERIVSSVPGGAANIQDIYPLAPLQEGILFHYLMKAEGDTYLARDLLSFDARERLDFVSRKDFDQLKDQLAELKVRLENLERRAAQAPDAGPARPEEGSS